MMLTDILASHPEGLSRTMFGVATVLQKQETRAKTAESVLGLTTEKSFFDIWHVQEVFTFSTASGPATGTTRLLLDGNRGLFPWV